MLNSSNKSKGGVQFAHMAETPEKKITTVFRFLRQYYGYFFLFLLICFFIFLRLYQVELRNQFTWDQIDNAWAAKHIIIDHQLPLLGMQAKGKTGFFIGPLYYYFITPFYFALNLNPLASGIIAAITGFIGVVVLFFVAKKMFSTKTAIFASIIQTVSMGAILFDRVQWPVQFIPILSLLAFYFLYKIMLGNAKYIPFLALIVGIGFHIHFTLMVFLPLITLLCLPFFPKKKETFLYGLIGLISFVIFLIPNIIVEITSKNEHTKNMTSYLQANFHGFHVRRMLQLTQDAFIQIEEIFVFSFLKPLKFILIPVMFVVSYKSFSKKNWFILCYLICLWFLVPWIIFTMYKSEISDYYFSFNRLLAVMLAGFVLDKIFSFNQKWLKLFGKAAVFLGIMYFAYLNFVTFWNNSLNGDIAKEKQDVLQEINKAGYIIYAEGSLKSYLFYAYTWEKYKRKAY